MTDYLTMDDPRATEADTLRRQAAVRPDRAAIIFEDRRTTYAQLNLRASQVANGLMALNAVPQQRIALLTKNSDYFFELVYGIAKARLVALPVNWRLSPREIAQILQNSGAQILFIGADFVARLADIERQGIRLDRVLTIDASPDGYIQWRTRQSSDDPMINIDREDIFLQLYTSGTTGNPKGVQISHRASMRMRELEVGTGGDWTRWDANDISIVAMPNFHVGGTSWALQWFARGATCVVQAQVDARAMLNAISCHQVTQMFSVPTVLDMMLADAQCAATDFSSLRLIHYGGAPITPNLLIRCMRSFGTQFVQYFGMTETNGVICVLEPHDHDLQRPELLRSCGKPYPGLDLRIMNAEGSELGVDQVGEICVRSPCLMSGYWRLPDLMAKSMFGEHYRTGDAGYKNAQGYLFLVDRVKDMIVSGGENIYPIEVERVLNEHPDVTESAVIGVPDPHWGEAVKAVIVARDARVNEAELIEFLKDKIARYKIPKSIDFVPALPRNAAGKVLKRDLRDRYRS